MSDGPHRTLPMRRPWRAVCEIADNAAHALDEVVERIAPALAADARGEISDGFQRQLSRALHVGDTQPVLFDDARQTVAALRARAGSPMEAGLADAIDDALRAGATGLDALRSGMVVALEDRGLAAVRHVEEHYLREVPQKRAVHVRERLEAGLLGAREAVARLAEDLVTGASAHTRTTIVDRSGLDDGVSL